MTQAAQGGQALERHVIKIVGSSLRHSFRTPLSLIVNALREVYSEVGQAPTLNPRLANDIRAGSAEIAQMRQVALEYYDDVSERFRNERNPPDLAMTRSILEAEVKPILLKIKDRTKHIRASISAVEGADIAEFAEIADVEASRMMRIFDGIIHILKVPYAFKATDTVNISGRVRVAVDQVQKNFQLEPSDEVVAEGGHFTIEGSTGLIDLLFLNLLENAVRYASRAPSFRVIASSKTLSGEDLSRLYPEHIDDLVMTERWVQIDVSNTGVSVPPEIERNMFKLYVTTESASDAPTGGGSGIGLALCSLIATLHGGTIFLNRRHALTTFTVLLPVVRPPSAEIESRLLRSVRQ